MAYFPVLLTLDHALAGLHPSDVHVGLHPAGICSFKDHFSNFCIYSPTKDQDMFSISIAQLLPSRSGASQIKFKYYSYNKLINTMSFYTKNHCLPVESIVHCVITYSRKSMPSKKRVTIL